MCCLKKIKDIRIGERVWAYDEETGEKSLQEVTHLIQSEGDKKIVDIELASGEVIQATDGHPFYVPESGEVWVEAGELDTGMLLYSIAGESVGLADVSHRQNYQQVYNLTVDQDHNYFVGQAGVLAHNTSSCDILGRIWGRASSRKLGQNLKKAGNSKMMGESAHHIVPGGAKRAREAQDHLARNGISSNDA